MKWLRYGFNTMNRRTHDACVRGEIEKDMPFYVAHEEAGTIELHQNLPGVQVFLHRDYAPQRVIEYAMDEEGSNIGMIVGANPQDMKRLQMVYTALPAGKLTSVYVLEDYVDNDDVLSFVRELRTMGNLDVTVANVRTVAGARILGQHAKCLELTWPEGVSNIRHHSPDIRLASASSNVAYLSMGFDMMNIGESFCAVVEAAGSVETGADGKLHRVFRGASRELVHDRTATHALEAKVASLVDIIYKSGCVTLQHFRRYTIQDGIDEII